MNFFSAIAGGSLSKKITDALNLLNETALLVNRSAVSDRFEPKLAVLRSQLQKAQANPAIVKEIQEGITQVRTQMRLAGYDLSMGKYQLVFDGFRNDDTMGSGFKRAVLFIGDKNFYWMTGDENHNMLAAALEERLARIPDMEPIRQIHSLWYQKTKTQVILSGAASEVAADYEQLKALGQADSLLFLSKLKGLI